MFQMYFGHIQNVMCTGEIAFGKRNSNEALGKENEVWQVKCKIYSKGTKRAFQEEIVKAIKKPKKFFK